MSKTIFNYFFVIISFVFLIGGIFPQTASALSCPTYSGCSGDHPGYSYSYSPNCVTACTLGCDGIWPVFPGNYSCSGSCGSASSYGGWGACSVSCGGGTQSRPIYNQCGSVIGTDYRACNTQSCGWPNQPTISSPINASTGVSLTPAIVVTATDNESNYLRYKIQIATNAGFSTNLQTFDQTVTQTGWSGQNTQTSTAYTSGTSGTYTLQSALTLNTTYYTRAYAIDPVGTNTWSPVSASISFKSMGASPTVPTLDLPIDTAVNSLSRPIFKTTSSDANSDYLRYKILLCTDVAMSTGCQTFDQTSSQTGWSGQNTQTTTAYTSGTQAIYTVQSNLLNNTTYFWRTYAIDPVGNNVWSATQSPPPLIYYNC